MSQFGDSDIKMSDFITEAEIEAEKAEAEETFAEAVKELEKAYDRALDLPYVKKPMAFALYSVWKKYDKKEA